MRLYPLGGAKKSTCVNKSIFLSIAKAMVYHQQRYTVVVSHQSVKTVYHHTVRCASICFRNDDIQHFVLMIYRNKLRMIYKAYALIYWRKCDIILTDESEINNGKSGHYEKENNQ